MADDGSFTPNSLLVDHGVVSSWSADSQRVGAQKQSAGNYGPTLISIVYTLVTLVPTLLNGIAVLAALRLAWVERPKHFPDLFQNRALRSAVATSHNR
jgi:hypothetical protein